ncbi:MAG TPA: shikimate dehydrogenase [Bacillota bacterium]|nr:shikimate dehydrogenase [Bacillota bacterium]
MNQFAFMIHPLEAGDVSRNIKVAQYIPPHVVESMLPMLPAFKAAETDEISSRFNTVRGWFVACPLTSRQMVTLPLEKVQRKIVQAGKLAERLGARILGLGAFTSIVGDGGLSLSRTLKIPVTSGNSYTVATTIAAIKQAASLMDIDLKRGEILILGGNGSIGSVCAQILAREANNLTLVGRNVPALEKLARRLLYETGVCAKISTDLRKTLPMADVVVAVSSAVEALIQPADLKPGAIVCDVARPRNVSRLVAEQRPDVLVIEGGLVEVPGEVNFHVNFGFPPNTCYACMAETIILTLEGRFECFSLGRELTVKQVDVIEKLGQKHGFKVAGFRSFERALSLDEINRIKERAKGNNKSACSNLVV